MESMVIMSISDIILICLATYIGANSMALMWIGIGVILGALEIEHIPNPIKEIKQNYKDGLYLFGLLLVFPTLFTISIIKKIFRIK